ncbi:hypothetical protein [Wolbachia endosymbiont (group A) of Andrena hattorfiana]|uniref:hypothetical protein n=1 Tax=Wolbachia endosymbiont (group A) of Andrena hattorfiana TaxID=2953977 RepID=UPI0021F8E94E|nr:hypothetical protein [Wolbachia endosymbiont (group A) of Andrena hattorfiana]
MGNTFRIDNKDPLYKKLIKLPTAYYRLEINNNKYTIHSHIGTAELGDTINDVKLQRQGDEIVLCTEDSALKLNGGNFVIEQEAIIGENQENIIKRLQSGEEALISRKNIKGSENFAIDFIISNYDGTELNGMLSFINFNDENDPVLQKIKGENGGLYFTIKDDNIYISDKNGKCLPVCEDGSCYKYQYTKDKCDVSTIIGNLTETNNKKQKFTLQKGEELSDNIYEANVALNDKPIATLPKIGYYMLDDQLIMRNHVTQEKVVIPRDFHYLKVVKFNNDDYKLTFCNFLGNEFFEYKKYDPQYSNVSDEYKFISLNCAKKECNPNLWELFSHRPSFFITEESPEPGSPGHHSVAVFEFISGKKGRKMATLIDELGSFNKEGKFQYCDYHTKAEYGVYDSSEINLKEMYTWTDANSEFYFTRNDEIENDNIILHTIQELL